MLDLKDTAVFSIRLLNRDIYFYVGYGFGEVNVIQIVKENFLQ